ncbi:hypothetical protein [Taklimakanibacter deserti]|uniref:hypothetical protein n=1 Tax=Taklimakanibacter deserti TaxID=2267839 RepID=UPI0013C42DE7
MEALSPTAQLPETSGQSPRFAARAPTLSDISSASPDSSPIRPLRNAERIAADRQKITESGVLDLLLDHVRGRQELTPSQISTAFGLLKKILPDFSTSAAPRDSEESRESQDDGASSDSDFELYIVDPKEA